MTMARDEQPNVGNWSSEPEIISIHGTYPGHCVSRCLAKILKGRSEKHSEAWSLAASMAWLSKGVYHNAWQVEIADNPMQLIRRICNFPTTPHQLFLHFHRLHSEALIKSMVLSRWRLSMQRASGCTACGCTGVLRASSVSTLRLCWGPLTSICDQ